MSTAAKQRSLTIAENCISEIEHIWQLSWRSGFYRGGPIFMTALAGIDIALWDMKGVCLSPGRQYSLLTVRSAEARRAYLSAPRRQS